MLDLCVISVIKDLITMLSCTIYLCLSHTSDNLSYAYYKPLKPKNHIGAVMDSMFASSVVDRAFENRSDESQ
jgi:hypothetical protein